MRLLEWSHTPLLGIVQDLMLSRSVAGLVSCSPDFHRRATVFLKYQLISALRPFGHWLGKTQATSCNKINAPDLEST